MQYQGGFLISKIHQIAGRVFSKKLKEYNIEEINPAQGRILFVLWQHDGISIQELSIMTSLGKSTLTSMLDRLEEAGYLKRVPSEDDRRKILIYPTNKDEHIKHAYQNVVSEMAELFYRGFEHSDIERFEYYLKRVFFNLSKEEKEG